MQGNMPLVPASQIAQVEPVTTGAVVAYSANLHTEITKIIVANTSNTSRTFRIFHDDDGANYSTNCALFYDVYIAPNASIFMDTDARGGGISVSRNGTIGARSPATAVLTFSIYGITQEVR